MFLKYGGTSKSIKLLSSSLIEAASQGKLEALEQLLTIPNIEINKKDTAQIQQGIQAQNH